MSHHGTTGTYNTGSMSTKVTLIPSIFRTATIWKDLEPFWGEEYTLFLPSSFTNVSVFVYDEETIR